MPPVVNYPRPLTFVSADWGKSKEKRSVHVATVTASGKADIAHKRAPKSGWSFGELLTLAASKCGSVLIGVDLALGVPERYWQAVTMLRKHRALHFVDWLRERGDDFFEPGKAGGEWSPQQPFFHVPKGGRRRTEAQLRGGFLRTLDWLTAANPIWALSGIPGSVGSGTVAFWRGLRDALRDRGTPGAVPFVVWPFEVVNEMVPFIDTQIVVAETYPRLAYAAALNEGLCPAPRRLGIPKTKDDKRYAVAQRFKKLNWVNEHLGSYDDDFRRDEDRFDSFLTAAAVVRCVLEGKPIVSPEWVECQAEGSMLLAGPVDPCPSEQKFPQWLDQQRANSPSMKSASDRGSE